MSDNLTDEELEADWNKWASERQEKYGKFSALSSFMVSWSCRKCGKSNIVFTDKSDNYVLLCEYCTFPHVTA